MFIAEEEHDCAGVVQLVHLVEVGHFFDVADVDDGEVFDFVGDFWGRISKKGMRWEVRKGEVDVR